MRFILSCVVPLLLAPGCSLTVRNPQACLFDGPSVCPFGMTCDAQQNQCVPIADGGPIANDGPGPIDPTCTSSFCSAAPAQWTSESLLEIWGSSATDIWVLQRISGVQHWNGTSWSQFSLPTTASLHGLSGFDAQNVWVVGDRGATFKWNGTSWMQASDAGATDLYGVWVESASSVWVSGYQGVVYQGDGVTWNAKLTQATYGEFLSIWGTDSQHVWAVSNKGYIASAPAWSAVQYGGGGSLLSVSGTSATSVWAVGTGAGVFRFDGTNWTLQNQGIAGMPVVNSVWAVDANTAWAVANSGTIYKWSQNTWTKQTSPTLANLNGVWNFAGTPTWIVGESGTLLKQVTP